MIALYLANTGHSSTIPNQYDVQETEENEGLIETKA
ncbi:MAG: hypothetical protein ACJAYB_001544 [Psychromonas sp.]|jgi:hypothetical protein